MAEKPEKSELLNKIPIRSPPKKAKSNTNDKQKKSAKSFDFDDEDKEDKEPEITGPKNQGFKIEPFTANWTKLN